MHDKTEYQLEFSVNGKNYKLRVETYTCRVKYYAVSTDTQKLLELNNFDSKFI